MLPSNVQGPRWHFAGDSGGNRVDIVRVDSHAFRRWQSHVTMSSEHSSPVTMAALAAMAGVSKNTVSLALRGDRRIGEATRSRIHALAEKHGYHKNPVVAHLMSELRKNKTSEYRRTLALLNAHTDREALTRHPTVSTWVKGCRRRAESQGYLFDVFWLHDPELNGPRLARILHARGISGAIMVGLFNPTWLPQRFLSLWNDIACVVTGVRTHEPTLSFCCVDHHALMLEAVRQVIALGYRRPALALSSTVDRLVEGRFSAGMIIGQQALPEKDRLPRFDKEDSEEDLPRFGAWMRRYRPDVLLTLHRDLKGWLERLSYRVPEDVGLVDLEHNSAHADWASMEQRNDLSGEAAVDLVVSMLHNNESGVPAFPRSILGSSHWVAGTTVRSQVGSAGGTKKSRKPAAPISRK